MKRIRLIHWNAGEAKERAKRLRAAGYSVDAAPVTSQATMPSLTARLPAAYVIDLSRLPSHGRDVAMILRQRSGSRHIPLVFVDGAAGKVARVRAALPDAFFTTWDRIEASLKKAIEQPPKSPVVPSSNLAGYSGTPLPKKLGIKEGFRVALSGAPGGFERTLGVLPEGALLRRDLRGGGDLILWFVRTVADLNRGIASMAEKVPAGGMWMIWPKQGSELASDIKGDDVRRIGLAAGLVDYKVCAVDATWSGLKFARRKPAGDTGAARPAKSGAGGKSARR